MSRIALVTNTAFLATVLALWALFASAEPLPEPGGPVLLTVDGAISNTNAGKTAVFDLEMLRSLGETEIVTETIWTPGMHRFTGVSLEAFLTAVGAQGALLDAVAINDYSVEIPLSDATEDGPIIAYEMDGKLMSRRDKGPLWMIYPYSSDPAYRTELIYSRSIWQLDRMTVME